MNKNLEYLTENVKILNRQLLEVSWKEVDFDSEKFANGVFSEVLCEEQNELICLITKNIPEWQRLLGCRQHCTHDYCLDIHTLSVLKRVKEFEEFKKLENYDKLILLYSALLHDIEKTENQVDPEHPVKGSKKSSSILFRLGFDEEFINSVYLLVNYHQVLGLMASDKISFSDEDLVKIFKNPKILELQTMLSIADIKSVKKNEMFFNGNMDEKIREIISKIRNSF